ncbi:MAG TPA: polyprenyl diphosphate synthase [Solirubrobacteraceae bacterium]|jgi:undecaprenyl diphosphate synthase|nr:polyprenyl diphosphate synthase [Solirubrobacteraceae bacterium]
MSAVDSRNGRSFTAHYVAMIADGNGRWASARGLGLTAGHEAGAETLRARLADAVDFGVRELTVYSFSTENWSRPAPEVRGLIEMLARRIAEETPSLHREGVRLRFIGRRREVPRELVEKMEWAERLTVRNKRIVLVVAFNYGGRSEIVDAARRFRGSTEKDFRAHLHAPDLHDPDLVIRTGGERRLSNFLLWQAAYSELVFRDELWPDFSREAFAQCIETFSARQWRFGGRDDPDERHAPGPRILESFGGAESGGT